MKKMNIANNADISRLINEASGKLYYASKLINEMDDKMWSNTTINYYANNVIGAVEELNKQIRDEIHQANNYVIKDNVEYANGIFIEPDVDEYGDI